MPFFDECCVLIPASTLEDFPSDLSSSDARSLLAGWTVLWHPALLAAAEQIPMWYRADAPPDPIDSGLVTVPAPSQSMLPSGFGDRVSRLRSVCWATGADRGEMLRQIAERLAEMREQQADDEEHPAHQVDPRLSEAWPDLQTDDRSIGVEDFYAAGYAALQVQVMTRRLRYTSNLDEIHLQTRVTAAAKAFVEGNGQAAVEALHDVFDCLAEERDHYFSSDPHLVDLTLAVPSTIPSLLDAFESVKEGGGESVLATPANVLIDSETAVALAESADPRRETFCQALVAGQIGWAGGGPADDACLDALSFGQAEQVFVDAWQRTRDAIGHAPVVYGRFSGTTPADLTRTLSRLGYEGVIPLDFASGTGYGSEAKVLLQAGGVELEALTAKPIDAADDAAFLTLGTKLGEAIDGGEIATALLAHWPGQQCPALQDLKRVATWSLVLGRFWKLDEYFSEGERPYHHGSTSSSNQDAHEYLDRCVEAKQSNPISSLAERVRNDITREHQAVLAGMTRMVTGADANANDPGTDIEKDFATAIGTRPKTDQGENDAESILAVNPHLNGVRHSVTVRGGISKPPKHFYAVANEGKQCRATVDVPGCGFVVVGGSPNAGSVAGSIFKRLRGGQRAIAEQDGLRNEFMEISICPKTGGIAGAYSGSRGNRMSMRLIRQRAGLSSDHETVMTCDHFSTFNSGTNVGRIETSGSLTDSKSGASLATFRLSYALQRGSRLLHVEGEVTPATALTGSPWHEYLGARVAVANEAAICRSLVRDKSMRARGRRLVAPLGLVIDEADRQTLISSGGLAFHRRVGDRFFDTLLQVEGETQSKFKLAYGLDVPNPIATTRAAIAPPTNIAIDRSTVASEIGWIVHASSKDLVLTTLDVIRREDQQLAAIVRVIQTRAQSVEAKLRFFHDVQFAVTVDAAVTADGAVTTEGAVTTDGTGPDVFQSGPPADDDPRRLECKGDAVKVAIGSHGVVDLLVVFAEPPR